jgi:hypothetical protein
MGVAVTFDLAAWQLAFPQFASLTQAQVTGQYGALPIAETYCRNDGGGPVSTAQTQTMLLGLMVAHVCQLLYGPNPGAAGGGASGIVGRISSATQGTISVQSEFPTTPNNAFFLQTEFGTMFWQACAAYRTARVIPGPRRNFQPWPLA